MLLRLGMGIFLTLNIMVASWLSYAREIFGTGAQAQGSDALVGHLFSYGALFLSDRRPGSVGGAADPRLPADPAPPVPRRGESPGPRG